MTREDQNSEADGEDWVDDVVSRALTSSYGSIEEPEDRHSFSEEDEDEHTLIKPEETYEHYPYPDEEAAILLNHPKKIAEVIQETRPEKQLNGLQ
jgi:hypothetical protein